MAEVKFEYCESCGIQLQKPEDRGKGDGNTWCKDCCNEDGSHKSVEEIKKRIKNLLLSPEATVSMGEKVSEEDIDNFVEDYMRKMPAWSQ